MEQNHVLGMICGYYLSRFDDRAYDKLNFGTQQATHEELGARLNVRPESIKNWRDEFDPIHDNARQGWHKREMYPSRRRAIEALGGLSEDELNRLVLSVLAVPDGHDADAVVGSILEADADLDEDGGSYGLRGPTGAKAETAYMDFHSAHRLPIAGILIDRRNDQCGFDFEIQADSDRALVEVKGLAGDVGGITLTDKEWKTAREQGDSYWLAIVRNVATDPTVSLIRDPASQLDPRMRTYTTIQVGWSVGHRSLIETEDRPNS